MPTSAPSPAAPWTPAERRTLQRGLWVGGVLVACAILGYLLIGPATMHAIAGGTPPSWLSPLAPQLAAIQLRYPERGEEFWQLIGRIAVTRVVLLILAGTALGLAWQLRERVGPFLTRWLLTPSHPLNLAIPRIVVFTLVVGFADIPAYRDLLNLPESMIRPIWGLHWLRPLIPIPESLGIPFIVIFAAACYAAIFGLWSRITLPLAAIMGWYALGLPQCYGKVNHWHHLCWFSLILAASPAADTLSLDALRARRKGLPRPAAALAYGVPLRLMWLLIGILYFGPGLWKLWLSGIDWIVTDNLEWLMYWQWHALGGWVPPVRPDHYPWFMRFLAAGTVLWEMGFIIAIFWPTSRTLAVAAGIGFHTATLLLMRVSFETLLKCYVVFIDWAAVCRLVATRWSIPALTASLSEEAIRPGRERISPWLWGIGAYLVIGNLVMALIGFEYAWPIACYPRYTQLHGYYFQSETRAVALELLDENEVRRYIPPAELKALSGLGNTQYDMLERQFISEGTNAERATYLESLIELLRNRGVDFTGITAVRVWLETATIHPDEQHQNPLARRELLVLPQN